MKTILHHLSLEVATQFYTIMSIMSVKYCLVSLSNMRHVDDYTSLNPFTDFKNKYRVPDKTENKIVACQTHHQYDKNRIIIKKKMSRTIKLVTKVVEISSRLSQTEKPMVKSMK